MEKWTEQEIEFLKANYSNMGSEKCSEIIGKTRHSIADYACRLNIKREKPIKPEKKYHTKRWTKHENDYLVTDYPNCGLSECAQKLGRTVKSIQHQTMRLGIKITSKHKSETQQQRALAQYHGSKRINVQTFIECSIPEVAYVLGFLWADGAFLPNHTICTDFQESDFQDIWNVFNKTGDWYQTHRPQRNQSSPQAGLQVNDKATFEFLADYGYISGRCSSPDSIIAHTGKFAPYWFRGYFDGDGCFYYKNITTQIAFSGIYNQDWSFICSLFNNMKINYGTQRRQNKNSKYSVIRCCQKRAIWKFGNYIYGEKYDDIGLKRKHDLFIHFFQTYSAKDQ